MRRLRPLRRLLPLPAGGWGLPEALLLAGYALTMAYYLKRSFHLFATNRPRGARREVGVGGCASGVTKMQRTHRICLHKPAGRHSRALGSPGPPGPPGQGLPQP